MIRPATFDDLLEQLVLDGGVDEEPRAGVADLALVVEHAPRDRGRRSVEVSALLRHDVRRLAAALEGDALHVRLTRVAEEVLAHLGGAGERDHVDVRMPADRLPRRLAEAGDDLEHAVGKACLSGELRETKRGQRRLLRGLEDDAVPGRERGTELPRGHHQGEVPRHHRADDAERLADDRDVRVGPGRRDLVVDLVDRLAVPGDALRGERHVDVRRVANRLAHVDRLQQRKLLGVLGHQRRQLLEDPLALLRGQARPDARLEGCARPSHRAVDVGRVARGDLAPRPRP